MNEIQAVKTAKIEEVKKNSKKGFTLVELVVVIAILAVLAAIAIPVVASTIKSSQISSAKTNAQTIETAIKEAKAAVAAGDDSIFVVKPAGGGTDHKASTNTITVADALEAKKVTSAATKTYTIDGVTYSCVYDTSAEKVYFAGTKDSKTVTIGDELPLTDANVVALTTTTGEGKDAKVTVIDQNVTAIKKS